MNIIKKTKILDVFRLYKYIVNQYRSTALLESLGDVIDDIAQYSIIGVIASEQLYEKNEKFYLKKYEDGTVTQIDNWLDIVNKWCGPIGNSLTPFQTGVIGYIGYEMHRFFEFVPNSKKLKSPVSKLFLTRYSLIYVFDRKNSEAYWISDTSMNSQIDNIEKKYNIFSPKASDFFILGDTKKDFEKKEYLETIQKCIHHIEVGDMLQANITMRFSGNYIGNPINLYEELRNTTPNPFFAYLDFEYPLISTSPESFLHISNNTITSRPIKGTVRTTVSGKDQVSYLESDPKNCSENIMITDLIRNDIGRVTKIGTVHVPVLCGTKKFNQIYHLETVVQGVLKDKIYLSDILKTNFPGGSITGAPKVKAMEIIDTLEFTERGPYCGVIGFFGVQGYVSSSIAIRILYFYEDKYYLHAGGGIVVRSSPYDEYNELLLKVESLINTLDNFNILHSEREKLDELTLNILRLISERIEIVRKISKIKKMYNVPIIQEDRMNYITELLMSKNIEENLNIPEGYIKNLLKVIFEESVKIEEES